MEEKFIYIEKKRWLFFGLPWTFTTYKFSEELLTVDTGFLNKVENDCYMYKIKDVRLVQSLWERIFKLGTIECYAGDVTSPQIYIKHVRNAKVIKDFILKASEDQRISHRIINTVGGHVDIGHDGCEFDN